MIADQVLSDGQIIVKNIQPSLSMLDSVIVHHYDGIYDDPAQKARVDWVVAQARGHQAVIEIGTATGRVISHVDAAQRAGVDNNIARLLLAKMRYPWIDFYYGNVFNLTPFVNQQFDCLIATEIIEHLPYESVHYALQHCLAVAPKLIITLPFGPKVMTNSEHLWEPTIDSFYSALHKTGIPTKEIRRMDYADDMMMFVVERMLHA
jgi:hypothetical protein